LNRFEKRGRIESEFMKKLPVRGRTRTTYDVGNLRRRGAKKEFFFVGKKRRPGEKGQRTEIEGRAK